MALKPRHKRRIFWGVIATLTVLALALVVVPPFVNLNHLKPRIENAIATQTGDQIQINGDVNFSLLGGTTIVARNVSMPNGTAQSVLFTVPFNKMFDLANASLSGDIFVLGAQLDIDSLAPPKFNNALRIQDSVIRFKGKDYYIINGELKNGLLRGTVRTNQHKYDFDSNGDEFHIKSRANNLDISGNLYSDGSARGTLSIDTDDVNRWFDFQEPKINRPVKLSMDFEWDGEYGFKFSNIVGDNFTGYIELFNDGHRLINLTIRDITFDLSFLLNGTGLFYDTVLDLDLTGNLTFAGRNFQHVKVDATGNKTNIVINRIVADDMSIDGGVITADGATNMPISLMFYGKRAYCLFNGNPTTWGCTEFVYGDLYGSLSVRDDFFEVFVRSDKKMPDDKQLQDTISQLGTRGRVNFQFADIGGTFDVNKTKVTPAYRFAKNKNLDWLGTDLSFLPGTMRSATGDFAWDANGLSFTPHSHRWVMSLSNGFFYISGMNAKDWFGNMDLQSLNDLEYIISGNYKNGNIGNLEIKIAGHLFKGSVTGKNITLSTELLNVDSFISQDFVDDYEERQFLTGEPLLLPFSIDANISLSANALIYNGNEFSNFVYSLKPNVQTFSITDSRRGNLLASVTRDMKKYNIVLQLNRFAIFDKLLSSAMPFNISDTLITAQINLGTSGQIAYDIWHNLSGTVDMSFDGGIVYGLGIDNFYANTENITKMNAEYALGDALDGGMTRIKKMRITGTWDDNSFASTEPFTLSMKHADATGTIQINSKQMAVNMELVLRGTSPSPAAIAMTILPNGGRDYSLSQIMIDFDADFLRDFVATHDKF